MAAGPSWSSAGGLVGNALGGGVYSTGSIAIDALTVIYGHLPEDRYGCWSVGRSQRSHAPRRVGGAALTARGACGRTP
jgi:hypothetical protein